MTPERFKEIRDSANYTQQQLADELGVSRLSVANWEKGKYNISPEVEAKMISLAGAPAKAEDPGAFIIGKNHPECYVGDTDYYTLAHPRWYTSGDCPLRNNVPASHRGPARVAELSTHIAPSMESVVDLFLQNWPVPSTLAGHRNNGWMHEEACKTWLVRRDRADLLTLIPHDPMHDINRAETLPAQTPEEIKKGLQLQKELDDAFTFDQPKGN